MDERSVLIDIQKEIIRNKDDEIYRLTEIIDELRTEVKDAKTRKTTQLEKQVELLKKDVETWKEKAQYENERAEELYWKYVGRFA